MSDDKLGDRVPPQNLEAEMSVLGSILLDPECMSLVAQLLNAEDFYSTPHQHIFRCLVDLYDRSAALDVVVVKDELSRAGNLESIGGSDYLLRLAESVPSAANVEHYAKIVRDRGLQRNLISTTTEILRESYQSSDDVRHLVESAEQKIFALSRGAVSSDAPDMRELLHQTMARIEALSSQGDSLLGISTGFTDIDDKLSGLQGSQLIIVAARPSMGKTSFALNVADRVAAAGVGVAVFSLEMSTLQVAHNLLCSHSQVDAQLVRRGQLDPEGWDRLITGASELSRAPIAIDDTPGLTILQIRAKARRWKAMNDIGLVIVDYLQLVTSPAAESRQQEISQISMGLKQLARELDVPVIALSQLNRSVDSREDHRPRMSDLRESGSIEQDADVIMFLFRPEYYEPERPDLKGLAEVIVAKQRNGPTGAIPVSFRPECMRFSDLSREEYRG